MSKHNGTKTESGYNGQSNGQLFTAAVNFQNTGQLAQAKELYHAILQRQPNHAEALHYLGLCSRQEGSLAEAVVFIAKSLEISPDNPSLHNSMGAVLCELNRFDDAENHLRTAIRLKPDNVEAHRNLGSIYAARQQFPKALGFFQTALSHDPDHFECLKAAGNALLHMGNPPEALRLFEHALSKQARNADLQTDTGVAFQMQEQYRAALEFHSIAICIAPGENRHWQAFRACIEGLVTNIGGDVEDRILHLLTTSTIPPYDLIMPVSGALFHRASFRDLITRHAQSNTPETPADLSVFGEIAQLAAMPLLLELMKRIPIANILTERMLTAIRRNLLLCRDQGKDVDVGFVSALALQCFTNEYAYAVTDGERNAVNELQQQIRNKLDRNVTPQDWEIALIGCYDPLFEFFIPDDFLLSDFHPELQVVLTRQLIEPHEENVLKQSMPQLTGIDHDISRSVRSQYEENPYPRWTQTVLTQTPKTIAGILQSPPLNFPLGDYISPKSPEILVAGCGTGQHAIQPATRFENARVTAIDLSLSSLAYAKRQCAKLGLSNIDFAQADLLELDNLDAQYDVIESVGVLHHLQDPVAGWQVLTKLLRPGGLMKIGLYSEHARHDVVAGREVVTEEKFDPTPDDMRNCRQFIINAASRGNPALHQLIRRHDFFSLSAFRDLVFHVQEHRFTLPAVCDALTKLNLEFLDFEIQFTGDLQIFRNSIHHHPSNQKLLLWDDYEKEHPDTFRGMYQFWCRKPA
ncbi:tetratricopeptide repeat protein [Thalassospira sp.]|uniref:tetratricopeptide repeat protein n=1 Tax=Thalassospira sp. TaxID=1912094 RepID=UPI0027339111|nr:tetratricopeptide repeat protein [Thalassospira sp.]MDP2699442.1 tetratricopeptide repeat protein [Thalassospira sp.]